MRLIRGGGSGRGGGGDAATVQVIPRGELEEEEGEPEGFAGDCRASITWKEEEEPLLPPSDEPDEDEDDEEETRRRFRILRDGGGNWSFIIPCSSGSGPRTLPDTPSFSASSFSGMRTS